MILTPQMHQDYSLGAENGVTKESMLGNAPFGIYVGKWDVLLHIL